MCWRLASVPLLSPAWLDGRRVLGMDFGGPLWLRNWLLGWALGARRSFWGAGVDFCLCQVGQSSCRGDASLAWPRDLEG